MDLNKLPMFLQMLCMPLFLAGCTVTISSPITVPLWLIVTYIFINKPSDRPSWNMFTGAMFFGFTFYLGVYTLGMFVEGDGYIILGLFTLTGYLMLVVAWALPNLSNSHENRSASFKLALVGIIILVIGALILGNR